MIFLSDPVVALAIGLANNDPRSKKNLSKTWVASGGAEELEGAFVASVRVAVETDIDKEILADLAKAGWEGDRESPHTDAMIAAVDGLKKMTPKQRRQTFIDSGILTQSGQLAPEYGGDEVVKRKPGRPPGSSKDAERFAPVRDALDSGLDQPRDGKRQNLNM